MDGGQISAQRSMRSVMKNHESRTSVFTSGSSIAWFYNIVYIMSQSRPSRLLLLPGRKRKYFRIYIFVFLRQALNELLGVNLTGLYHWFAGYLLVGFAVLLWSLILSIPNLMKVSKSGARRQLQRQLSKMVSRGFLHHCCKTKGHVCWKLGCMNAEAIITLITWFFYRRTNSSPCSASICWEVRQMYPWHQHLIFCRPNTTQSELLFRLLLPQQHFCFFWFKWLVILD